MKTRRPWNTVKYDVIGIRKRLKIVDHHLTEFRRKFQHQFTDMEGFHMDWIIGAVQSIDDQVKSLRCHACDTRICKHKFKDKEQTTSPESA